MGYTHIIAEGKLNIKKENFNKLKLKVIKESRDWEEIYPEDIAQMGEMEDIKELFDMFYFQVIRSSQDYYGNSNGDIINCYFNGEDLTNCFEFMNCIAPFVEEGCFIDFRADMDIWRWVFLNGECKEVFPELIFELDEENIMKEKVEKTPTCCRCHTELLEEHNHIELWGQELPICHYCEQEYITYDMKETKQWCIDKCDEHYKKILGLIEDLQTGEISASQMWQLMFNKTKEDLNKAIELAKEEWKQDFITGNVIE